MIALGGAAPFSSHAQLRFAGNRELRVVAAPDEHAQLKKTHPFAQKSRVTHGADHA
ncbi:hypothetical protein [Thermophilibacter sp.]